MGSGRSVTLVRVPGLLAVIVSAAAFGSAFPPRSWSALAWVALAPLFVALRRARGAGEALLLVWIWSLAAAWAVGDWFPRSVAAYFEQPLAVGVALFFGVCTLMAGPYYFAFALAYRALPRRLDRALPFVAAAAWTAAELGRGRLFTGSPLFIGNPWGLLGYSQLSFLPLVQIAAVTGVYGVSFVVACVNAALAEAWLRRGSLSGIAAARRAALAALPAAAALGLGAVALGRAHEPDGGTRVALVQGAVDVGTRWEPGLYGANLEAYLALTRDAARNGAPRIAFWPEAALTFFLAEEPAFERAIRDVQQPLDLEIVTGGPHAVDGPSGPLYFNSVFSLDPRRGVRARYDKQHLLPFAEYFPLRIDVMRRRFGRVRAFEHGREAGPLATRAGPAGVLICNEAMLPEVVARRVASGAAYLFNPSNDSWISHPRYTGQQLDIARMRAVEQRRWLVRVSTAGPSALIDPWGRLHATAPIAAAAVVQGSIRPRTDLTPYARLGDAFGFACVACVGAALVLPAPRRGATVSGDVAR